MATVATVATVPLSRLVDWMSGIEGPAIGPHVRKVTALFEELFIAVVTRLAERL